MHSATASNASSEAGDDLQLCKATNNSLEVTGIIEASGSLEKQVFSKPSLIWHLIRLEPQVRADTADALSLCKDPLSCPGVE